MIVNIINEHDNGRQNHTTYLIKRKSKNKFLKKPRMVKPIKVKTKTTSMYLILMILIHVDNFICISMHFIWMQFKGFFEHMYLIKSSIGSSWLA